MRSETFKVLLLTLLLTTTILNMNIVRVLGETSETFIIVSVDVTSIPLQIIYVEQTNMVYVALQIAYSGGHPGGIAEINVTDKTCNVFTIPYSSTVAGFNGFVVYDGENVWGSIGFLKVPHCNLTLFNVKTKTFTITNITCSPYCALYHLGYLWVPRSSGYLQKIDVSTVKVVATYELPISYPAYMLDDGEYIWVSSVVSGKVVKFNTLTNSVDLVVEGLDRPLGMAIKDSLLLVAENHEKDPFEPARCGNIVVLNKHTGKIVENITTAEIIYGGPYMVYVDSKGIIWWTDNSKHVGMVSWFINKTFSSHSPYCYFMTEVLGNTIWFTGKGSANVEGVYSHKGPDINGDGKVDMKDVAKVSWSYGAVEGDVRYSWSCDVNNDYKIDMKDVAFVSKWFGKVI